MTSPTQLVSLTDAMSHLNIPNSQDFDTTELQGFIDAATAYIQRFTGPIVAQTFTETHNGGGPTVVLRNPPVLSIQSVTEYVGATGYTLAAVNLGDANIGAYSYTLDDPETGVLRRRWNGGIAGPFVGGDSNVVVTYTAGRSSVPADIRMAVLQDIAGLYQPSQLGGNPYDAAQGVSAGNAPLNPIGMFPRVTEILADGAKRSPAIA